MAKSDIEQLEIKYTFEYKHLLDLLANVLYVNKDLSVNDSFKYKRLEDAHLLTYKFFCHALTVLYLSKGTKQELQSLKWDVVDFASVDVLTRAAFEAFLVFHHVFYEPTQTEEKDYRYLAFKAEGILNKQYITKLIGTKKENNELMKEKREIEKYLLENEIFRNFKDARRKDVFKGSGMWRWEHNRHLSWRDIGVAAGLSKFLADYVYHHLCATAHSSSIGVYQTVPTLDKREEKHIYSGTAAIMNIVIANLIKEYCGLFSKSQEILYKNTEVSDMVKQWIQRGQTLDKLMGIGNDKV